MKIRSVLFVLAVGWGCTRADINSGNYRRIAYVTRDDRGQRLPPNIEVDSALPSALVIRSRGVYELETGGIRARGEYRVEGDSVFFDERTNAGTVVSALGVIHGDTIKVRMPPLLLGFGGAPGWDMQVTFVRRP